MEVLLSCLAAVIAALVASNAGLLSSDLKNNDGRKRKYP
jgi:hypothetical protein